MFVVVDDRALQGKKVYLSLEHEGNKHGFPVYVKDIEKATKFRTKSEAKARASKGDKIEKC